MKFRTGLSLFVAVQAAVASPCKPACQPDDCLSGVLGSESGLNDCRANLLATTTVPGAQTTTTAPQVTITVAAPVKRNVAFNIPSYASACSNDAQYASACSCAGVTAVTTEVSASTTETITETTTTTTTTAAFPTYTIQVVAKYAAAQSSDNIYAGAVNAPIMFYTMTLQPSEDAAVQFELNGKDWSLKALTGPPAGLTTYESFATYNTANMDSGVGLIPGSYLQSRNQPKGIFRLDASNNLVCPWGEAGDALFWHCNGKLFLTHPDNDYRNTCSGAIKLTLTATILSQTT